MTTTQPMPVDPGIRKLPGAPGIRIEPTGYGRSQRSLPFTFGSDSRRYVGAQHVMDEALDLHADISVWPLDVNEVSDVVAKLSISATAMSYESAEELARKLAAHLRELVPETDETEVLDFTRHLVFDPLVPILGSPIQDLVPLAGTGAAGVSAAVYTGDPQAGMFVLFAGVGYTVVYNVFVPAAKEIGEVLRLWLRKLRPAD